MECKQCGECCKWPSITKNYWYDHANYTDDEKELLMKNKQNVETGCEMLKGDICLVHKLLGIDRKPKNCREYNCEKTKDKSNKEQG